MYSRPSTSNTPACFAVILKLCFVSIRNAPSRTTANEYRKNSIDSIAAPLFINGTANSGLSPYVIPVIMPAGYPIIAFLLSGFISLSAFVLQRYTQKPYSDARVTKILDSDLDYSSAFVEARWVPRSIIARATKNIQLGRSPRISIERITPINGATAPRCGLVAQPPSPPYLRPHRYRETLRASWAKGA